MADLLTTSHARERRGFRKLEAGAADRDRLGHVLPDRRLLRPGQWIRLLHVPEADRLQRERELRDPDVGSPGWTADTFERIVRTDPVVRISRIDEYGQPWFEYEFENGEVHSIAIMDDESWEHREEPGG